MFSLQAKLNLAKCSIEKRVKSASDKYKRQTVSALDGTATGQDGVFSKQP